MKPVILVLFPLAFDEQALLGLEQTYPEYEFVRVGFDLFTFPQNLRLFAFDVERFVDRLLRRFRRRNIASILSTQEQFGALAAALACERLGLPGTSVEAIVRAQNKGAAREIHQRTLPDHTPAFCTFRFDADPASAVTIGYPAFVKPVKAAFSVLARRCEGPQDLARLLDLSAWDRWVIRALTRPFRRVSPKFLDCAATADHFIAETLIDNAVQVCVDGYALNGRIEILGVVDSIMYPGTDAFMRFEYPSRLAPSVIDRFRVVATKAVAALGFSHGLFNVELRWQPDSDRIWIVEVNPRMAGQFSDLYERVTGRSLWAVQLPLALGKTPPAATGGSFGAAASFVFREFGAATPRSPSPEALAWLSNHHPDAVLHLDLKHGASRRREERWVGNYRYALLHMGAADHAALMESFAIARQRLDFFGDGSRQDAPGRWLSRLRRSF